MICNIADGTWTLESKDIDNLNLIVAKIVTERANADKIKTFNTEKFVKYIHDLIEKKTGDPQQAITFARQVPSALQMTMMSFPDVKVALKGKGYDVAAVDNLLDRFNNSLQDVANFIAEQSGSKGAKDLAGQINSAAEGERLQPKPNPSPLPVIVINKKVSADLPYNPLSTTGNESKPGREWYYGFIKKLGKIMTLTGKSNDGTVSFQGVPGGVRLSLVKGGISIDQLYPDMQSVKNIEDITSQQFHAVVTNKNGEYVYFDNGYNVTTKENGKLIYFPIRTVPSFKVNESGIREYNLQEQLGISVQTIADRLKKDSSLTKQKVINEYSMAYDAITNMKEYLDKNPGEILPLNITGYSEGTINYNSDAVTLLSNLKTNYSIEISRVGKKDTKLIRLSDGTAVRLAMAAYTPEMANTVADLLTGDVIGADGQPLSAQQKYVAIRDFTILGADGGISINTTTGQIYLEGETLNPKDPDVKSKIINFLTRNVTATNEDGKTETFKNQFSYNEPSYIIPNRTIDMFSLTPLGNGKFEYVSNPIPYKEWLVNNAYIKAEVDENGDVMMLNGYIKYDANIETLSKITPESEEVEETSNEEIEEMSKPKLSNLGMTFSEDARKAAIEATKARIDPSKLYSMRDDSVKATAKQVEDGDKWYNTTEITFRDSKGKQVTKKLSEVVPYQVLFKYANTNPKIKAQFTKSGITLFKGSDSTDLYHEAWHAFTQLFMTNEEREVLYNEVKKLNKTITYYNHGTAKWETMNSGDLDFSNMQHILYAEEYLADEFREYAKTQKTESSKFRSFFKKLWEALKALFGKADNNSLAVHLTESELLNSAFNELYTGDFVDRTYNQENVQFDVLYSGITLNIDEKGVRKTIDVDASLAISEAMGSYISDYVDMLTEGLAGEASSKYTLSTLYDPETKKIALRYAFNSFVANRDRLLNQLDNVTSSVEQQVIEKRLSYIQDAIDKFGDLENLNNNKEIGVIAYYNQRTGFLDTTESILNDEELSYVEGTSENAEQGDPVANQLESNDGTKKTDYQRVSPEMKFLMGSVHKRVEVTDENPDGYKYNIIGGIELADPRVIYNLVSAAVEGSNTIDEMYEKLSLASDKKTNGELNPTSLMLKQFLGKLGEPTDTALGAHSLWVLLFHSVRYDRIQGMKMLVKKRDSSIEVVVGVADSAPAALGRDFANQFISYNPSPFKSYDAQGNVRISVKALKNKYAGKSIENINPIEFFGDLGIRLTNTEENIANLNESGIVDTILKFRLEDKQKGLFNSNVEYITRYSGQKREDSLVYDHEGNFKKLYEIESRVNPLYANYMSKTAEEKPKSERSNPSSAGNVILDLNNSDSLESATAQPHLAHFNPAINPAVKTSQIFQRMFGANLQGRMRYKGVRATLDLKSLEGTQLINLTAEIESMVKGIKSSDSDKQTAWLRDFFFTNMYGATEAYKHADKSSAYIAKLIGDPSINYYVRPELFVQARSGNNASLGRDAANAIILDYVGSELERIKKVKASKNNVYGEKASDIILYLKDGKYVTYEDAGSKFTVFDGVLSDAVKNELINSNINTVEEFRSAIRSNADLKFRIETDLNNYFNNEIGKDTETLRSYGLSERSGLLSEVKKKFDYNVEELQNGKKVSRRVYAEIDTIFPAAVENFVYTSFIHRVEMNTLVYGDPAIYNHNKDEHMKRVAAFFATGKIPVTGATTQSVIANNPGIYTSSAWFKNTGLPEPEKGVLEGDVLSTAVLEDAFEDSVYFDTMVKYAARVAVNKKQFQDEASAIKFYSKKYGEYKNMKSADAQAWISFDAYRALEMRFGNWGPVKQKLYEDIINGVEVDADRLAIFFPVKKLQYGGALSTKNFPVNAFHKYSVMPLIPSVIKDSHLEKLHNKMVSQGIAYAVMHSGSKLASLGKDGKLDLFYTERNSSAQPAYTKPGYTFTKNDIFLQYLKEQLATHDTWNNKQKFPTQARKLITSGVLEQGFPVDFKPNMSDEKRRKLWNSITDETEKENESPAYALEQRYQRAISKMIDVAKEDLKKELGYADGKINKQKLIEFIKTNLAKRDISLYDIDYIKLSSTGNILLPLDLANDPAKIEKLVNSLVNKRIIDQMIYGEAYIQGSGIGFEKFTKPTKKDLEKYGTNGLLFYRPLDKYGKVTDDPKKTVSIGSMQVKVALQGDFVKLLKLKDLDGKVIGTRERLNELIRDEEWLNTGDHRKMLTMGGTRIPTASMNYIESMEVAEFLPAEAGNIIIVPSEIVAKSGGDFDIDKLIVIRPVISDNKGVIELTRPKATTKTLEQIVEEKKKIKDYIAGIYDDYNEYIDEVRKQKLAFTPEQKEEFDTIKNTYRKPINALRKELNNAYDRFIADPNASNASYQEVEDSLQSQIDKLTEEEATVKREFLKRAFGENFLNETLDRRNTELEEENEKLRELNRESNSFKPRAYQNDILDAWSDLLLRPANYVSLTTPNSTDIFTDDDTGIVKDFSPINRKEQVIKSPTKIMQNRYNIDKAVAMSSGKTGISMLASGATFFPLYKSVGLAMQPASTVYNSKGTSSWSIENVIRMDHNYYVEDDGTKVVSLSHTLDANNEYDIADVISQIMNGYLDVAKKDWVFDINAVKEFEGEVEFMVMGGVPIKTAVALASQPMVREYLQLVQSYNGVFPLAKGEISNPNFAKYQAMIDVLEKYRPDLAITIDKKGNIYSKPTGEVLSLAQEFLNDGNYFFTQEELMKQAKTDNTDTEYALATFLHFLEVQNMAKGNVELKRNLNFDTDKQQSLFEATQKEANLRELSDRFSTESINNLLNKTVLHNFIASDIMVDAVSALLPLRGVRNINTYLARVMSNQFMDKDVRERYESDFVNNLTSYMFYNYHNTFDPAATTYKSADISKEVTIEKEPQLGFGAFYDEKTGKLAVDNYAIDNDYKTKAFAKEGYGLGLVANLPIDMFAGYPDTKARAIYRQFVYEREMLRNGMPYKSIEKNQEFRYFAEKRMTDLSAMAKEGEVVNYDLPQLYEEFIRNKALDNTFNVNALFKTDRQLGIFSIADRFDYILSQNEALAENYDVLKTLRSKSEQGYTFLTQKFREKDPDKLTAYTSQMMNLMDPSKVIAEREAEKEAIAAFFSKLPLIAFMQAGNDPNSRISMGSIFDQTRTGLPEMLEPALNTFINDLNSNVGTAILANYKELFEQKQASVDPDTGKYTPGAIFVNWSSSIGSLTGALTPSNVRGHSGGAAGADTKWDEIGQEFGPVKFNHYYTGTRSEKNAPKGNVDISKLQVAITGSSKVAEAANKMWGNQKDGKIVPYAYATMKDERLIRNWAQVYYSDAVFAIAPIGKAGDVWSEDGNKKKEEQRIVVKSEIVQGGTGYAVEMAIQAGKPVYVYNDPNAKAQSHLPKGWYTWDGSQFVAIETPTLTRNFAAIGSRGMSAEAEQAIRDVYKKTFGESAQASTARKTYSGKVDSLQPNQIFVFGSNEGSSKGGKPTHGSGSAKLAKDRFGAIQGQSRGLQGQSYAIVTKKFYDVKKSSTPEEIIDEIKGLYEYAKQNSNKEFLISDYSETNLNGYSGKEMADMFNAAGPIPSNIVFNENFNKLVSPESVKQLTLEEKIAKADTLTPIQQNFKDGSGGRKMQPQFAGKSTMDLIISGDRTRTTRAKTDISRMLKDYGLSSIFELKGMVIRMTDNTGRQVYTEITKVAPFTQDYQDATWQKEGWVKEVTDKHVDNYPYAIEFKVVQPTVQVQAPIVVKPGVEISSNAKGLAGALTNPTELAKRKGNISNSYPVEFRGKTYEDSEAAYHANKGVTLQGQERTVDTYKLMVEIITAKLQQHPRLASEITKQGGSAWILSSTHQPTKKNSVWETGGKNWFIKALNEAYVAVAQPATQTTVKESVTDLFENNPELANEVYESLGFASTTLPDRLPYKTGKIYNTAGKEIFAGIVDGQVYINKDLIDKYSNKEILDNQETILNTILKNLNVYDILVNLPKEQFINFLVAHEKAHLEFEKEGRTFKTEQIEEAYVNARALIEVGILKAKDFDLTGTNEGAVRLEKYFPTTEEYINDMTELVAKEMDNATVSLSTTTGYKTNIFTGSLWGKKLETSSMDDFYFLQKKDGYPKNKEELRAAISEDMARHIPQAIKEKYWRGILESLPDDEKALLSNWAYYTNYKNYTSQYGKPTFNFNEIPYPEFHTEGEKEYTKWTSFISSLFSSFDGASRDLWLAKGLLADSKSGVIEWYKNLTPEKLDKHLEDLSKAMAFKSMVVASVASGSSISATDSSAVQVQDLKKAYYDIKQRTEISPLQISSAAPQITAEQKKEAELLYSQYLDTIFPDSQVKDVLYHGTPDGRFEKFDLSTAGKTTYQLTKGIYFTDSEKTAEYYAEGSIDFSQFESLEEYEAVKTAKIFPVVLNAKNLVLVDSPQAQEQQGDAILRTKDKISDVGRTGYELDLAHQYIVFNTDQIHILGDKQDIGRFKNFVASQPTIAPVTAQAASFERVQTERLGETGGPFPGLIKNQPGVPTVVNTQTAEVMKPALIYDELKFVSNGTYALDTKAVQEIGAANPGKLFVFDDFFLTETGVSMDAVDKSQTRQAWMPGKAMGISLGIPTLAAPVSTATPVTDQNYDKLKAQIDKALDRLLEKKGQGMEIVFPSRGLGQTFVGFDIQPTENVKTNNRPAPSLFVYLSKRLLQDFGYQNPTLSLLTSQTPGVTTTLGTETGSEFVQGYYKGIGAQTVTDTDIKEFIKKCKGLS